VYLCVCGCVYCRVPVMKATILCPSLGISLEAGGWLVLLVLCRNGRYPETMDPTAGTVTCIYMHIHVHDYKQYVDIECM